MNVTDAPIDSYYVLSVCYNAYEHEHGVRTVKQFIQLNVLFLCMIFPCWTIQLVVNAVGGKRFVDFVSCSLQTDH